MKWICTDKQLPENRQRVLMAGNWAGTQKVIICIFLKKYSDAIFEADNVFIGDGGGTYRGTKMYWMPLPKSPFEK